MKNLEEREKQIKYSEMKCVVNNQHQQDHAIITSNTVNNNNVPIVMSGKCNYNSGDLTDRSSQNTIISSNTIPSGHNMYNLDENKIREYQQSLLEKSNSIHQHQSSNPQIEFDLESNIEARKKEILQRFGVIDSATSSATNSMANFNRRIVPSIQLSEDKYTISTDSGFASWRNHQQQQQQQLNAIINNKSILKTSTNKQQQQTIDNNVMNRLYTNLNHDSSDTSVDDNYEHGIEVNTPTTNANTQRNGSKLFGLEYYDGQTSEIRDLSIEHLIGLIESQNSSNKLTLSKSNLSINNQLIIDNRNDTSLYESTLSSTSCTPSPLIHPQQQHNQNQHHHHLQQQQQQFKQHKEAKSKDSFNTDDGIDDTCNDEDDNECDDDSHNIILSLLNSRNQNANNNNNNANKSDNSDADIDFDINEDSDDDQLSLDIRRKMIEEQLELIRIQKEQLYKSQQMLSTSSSLNNLPAKSLLNFKVSFQDYKDIK